MSTFIIIVLLTLLALVVLAELGCRRFNRPWLNWIERPDRSRRYLNGRYSMGQDYPIDNGYWCSGSIGSDGSGGDCGHGGDGGGFHDCGGFDGDAHDCGCH